LREIFETATQHNLQPMETADLFALRETPPPNNRNNQREETPISPRKRKY
jgi:hypothetical protein